MRYGVRRKWKGKRALEGEWDRVTDRETEILRIYLLQSNYPPEALRLDAVNFPHNFVSLHYLFFPHPVPHPSSHNAIVCHNTASLWRPFTSASKCNFPHLVKQREDCTPWIQGIDYYCGNLWCLMFGVGYLVLWLLVLLDLCRFFVVVELGFLEILFYMSISLV